MLNTDDFVKRLEILFEYYGITASAFADTLTVQRSSLSHLMSGRNKPSLDFVMRITEAYPEADLYWLLNGEGEFPKKEQFPHKTIPPVAEEAPAPALPIDTPAVTPPPIQKESEMPDLFSANEEPAASFTAASSAEKNIVEEKQSSANLPQNIYPENEIERIVVFYKNGTFKNYTPGN
ncbi:MAG: helix-turn-helix transcriptional regulator [Bacteroidota bacterium]